MNKHQNRKKIGCFALKKKQEDTVGEEGGAGMWVAHLRGVDVEIETVFTIIVETDVRKLDVVDEILHASTSSFICNINIAPGFRRLRTLQFQADTNIIPWIFAF